MSKDITVVRDVLCGHAQGLSLKKIQEVTGVPKTSVKRIVDQAHATELSIDALLHLPDEAGGRTAARPFRRRSPKPGFSPSPAGAESGA